MENNIHDEDSLQNLCTVVVNWNRTPLSPDITGFSKKSAKKEEAPRFGIFWPGHGQSKRRQQRRVLLLVLWGLALGDGHQPSLRHQVPIQRMQCSRSAESGFAKIQVTQRQWKQKGAHHHDPMQPIRKHLAAHGERILQVLPYFLCEFFTQEPVGFFFLVRGRFRDDACVIEHPSAWGHMRLRNEFNNEGWSVEPIVL
jgi:hypothetical protein